MPNRKIALKEAQEMARIKNHDAPKPVFVRNPKQGLRYGKGSTEAATGYEPAVLPNTKDYDVEHKPNMTTFRRKALKKFNERAKGF